MPSFLLDIHLKFIGRILQYNLAFRFYAPDKEVK
jgi:hypothetical protein